MLLRNVKVLPSRNRIYVHIFYKRLTAYLLSPRSICMSITVHSGNTNTPVRWHQPTKAPQRQKDRVGISNHSDSRLWVDYSTHNTRSDASVSARPSCTVARIGVSRDTCSHP